MRLVEDLATKRNEVAHGAVSEVLANSVLAPYVSATEGFGLALCDELQLVSAISGARYGNVLGSPLQLFDRHIVCLRICNATVHVGDYLLAETADSSEPYRLGEILEIQKDHASVEGLAAPPDVEAGFRMSCRFKENHKFTHIPRQYVL